MDTFEATEVPVEPMFILCSFEEVSGHYNRPVNMSHCSSFSPEMVPDGYIISFESIGVDWLYPTEKDRNKDLAKLIEIYGMSLFNQFEFLTKTIKKSRIYHVSDEY